MPQLPIYIVYAKKIRERNPIIVCDADCGDVFRADLVCDSSKLRMVLGKDQYAILQPLQNYAIFEKDGKPNLWRPEVIEFTDEQIRNLLNGYSRWRNWRDSSDPYAQFFKRNDLLDRILQCPHFFVDQHPEIEVARLIANSPPPTKPTTIATAPAKRELTVPEEARASRIRRRTATSLAAAAGFKSPILKRAVMGAIQAGKLKL